MEHLSIKPNGYTDNANRNQTGSSQGAALAGLATNFKELVSKAGIHIDYRLNLFVERSGIAAIGKTVNPAQHDDGHRPDAVRNDHDSANSVDRSARDNYSEDHSSAEPVERGDDSSRNQSDARHGEHDDSAMEDQADSGDTGSSERHTSDDGGNGDQENSSETATSTVATLSHGLGAPGIGMSQSRPRVLNMISGTQIQWITTLVGS